jgi:hypothetical protein
MRKNDNSGSSSEFRFFVETYYKEVVSLISTFRYTIVALAGIQTAWDLAPINVDVELKGLKSQMPNTNNIATVGIRKQWDSTQSLNLNGMAEWHRNINCPKSMNVKE